MRTHIALVVLIGLLAQPITQTASPAEAKKRPRIVTRTFPNMAPINLPTSSNDNPVSADLYPSAITVGGRKGKIRDINLTLNDFSHTSPEDMRVLLVGPNGQTAIVMAFVGGGHNVSDVTLTLDDEAGASLPDDAQFQSGAFRPTNANDNPILFIAPAPPVTDLNAALSVFDGTNPNGPWRLFVQDEYGASNPGAFAGGWELEITTKVKAKKKKR